MAQPIEKLQKFIVSYQGRKTGGTCTVFARDPEDAEWQVVLDFPFVRSVQCISAS